MSGAEEGEVHSRGSSDSHDYVSLSPPSLDDGSLESADESSAFPLSKTAFHEEGEDDAADDQLNIQPPQVTVSFKRNKKSRKESSKRSSRSGRDGRDSRGSKSKSSRREEKSHSRSRNPNRSYERDRPPRPSDLEERRPKGPGDARHSREFDPEPRRGLSAVDPRSGGRVVTVVSRSRDRDRDRDRGRQRDHSRSRSGQGRKDRGDQRGSGSGSRGGVAPDRHGSDRRRRHEESAARHAADTSSATSSDASSSKRRRTEAAAMAVEEGGDQRRRHHRRDREDAARGKRPDADAATAERGSKSEPSVARKGDAPAPQPRREPDSEEEEEEEEESSESGSESEGEREPEQSEAGKPTRRTGSEAESEEEDEEGDGSSSEEEEGGGEAKREAGSGDEKRSDNDDEDGDEASSGGGTPESLEAAPAWKRELMEQERADAERHRAAAAAAEEADAERDDSEDEDAEATPGGRGGSDRDTSDEEAAADGEGAESGGGGGGEADGVERGAPPPPSPPTPPELRLPPYYPAIQGCRLVEEFQCLNRIEEGTFGVVYRARDKRTNETVALKRLKMEKEKEGFPITSLREINTLLKAQHENIVTVREIVVGSNMDKIYIVMDYVEHDLKSLMETMKAKKQVFVFSEVKTIMLQLLRAIAHLHDNWILHRDIKTSNLLLNHRGVLKVGDFGLAREYGSPLKAYTAVVVTLWYRAPELLLGAKEYSTPIDVWSVGCVFGELLLMEPLFQGKSEIDQLNKIFKDLGTPNEKLWQGYKDLPGVKKCAFVDYPYNNLKNRFGGCNLTQAALDLMNLFFRYDPKKRISAETALKHGWFLEEPLPKDPALFPTWPAKSELGHRKSGNSPKPPSGGGQYKDLNLGDDDDKIMAKWGGAFAAQPAAASGAPVGLGPGFTLKF